MNRLEIENYITDSLSINIIDKDELIAIEFSGEIDMQDPETLLLPFFEKIHNKILELNLKEICLNFEKLNFLNSSGIKALIKWIQLVLLLPSEKKYTFKIYASSKIPWQINSLKLLSILSSTLIQVIIV